MHVAICSHRFIRAYYEVLHISRRLYSITIKGIDIEEYKYELYL